MKEQELTVSGQVYLTIHILATPIMVQHPGELERGPTLSLQPKRAQVQVWWIFCSSSPPSTTSFTFQYAPPHTPAPCLSPKAPPSRHVTWPIYILSSYNFPSGRHGGFSAHVSFLGPILKLSAFFLHSTAQQPSTFCLAPGILGVLTPFLSSSSSFNPLTTQLSMTSRSQQRVAKTPQVNYRRIQQKTQRFSYIHKEPIYSSAKTHQKIREKNSEVQ